jgi:hypothetical protein
MLLLERKPNVKPIKLIKINEYVMMINDPIVPEKDIYYEIEIYSNFKGKVRSVFRYTPEVSIEIRTNSSLHSGRTSSSMLKAGIFSQFYIKTIDDFKRLINKEDGYKENSISAYYIRPLHSDYYEDKIKITQYKIIQ